MSEANQTTGEVQTTAKQKPVHRIRLGLIAAAIWRNDTQHGPMYQATVERRYQDTDEKTGVLAWKSSDSFKIDDLPAVREALRLAFEWMYQNTK